MLVICEVVCKPKIVGYIISKEERDDVLHEMADYLYSNGSVVKSYGDSVIERENNYPTGIDVEPIPVAIPHSERNEVLKTTILVGKTKEQGVAFEKIEGDGNWIQARVVFLLAVDSDQGQLEVIAQLMNVIQDAETVQRIVDALTSDEIETIVSTAFDTIQV